MAGGPGQVLHGQPGLEARVHLLLHCQVHWSGFHGNARVFSFQIRSQRMEKDPGLGARSSGESSLRGRNGKSCSNAPLCFLTLAGRDPTVLLPLAAPRPGSEPPHPRARVRGCRRARRLPPSMSVVAPASVAVCEQPCCATPSEGTWGRRLHAGRARPSEARRAARRRLGLCFPSDRISEFREARTYFQTDPCNYAARKQTQFSVASTLNSRSLGVCCDVHREPC